MEHIAQRSRPTHPVVQSELPHSTPGLSLDPVVGPGLEDFLCPVDEAARIIGQKWTLQIVHELLDRPTCRFCELQEALGGVNPSTLSSRLKMLEEEGLVRRVQISTVPPHVEYSLTAMGQELRDVIAAITQWSNTWLCHGQSPCCGQVEPVPAPQSIEACIDQ